MDKELQDLKTQVTHLQRELTKLKSYSKSLAAIITEANSVKNSQISRLETFSSWAQREFEDVDSGLITLSTNKSDIRDRVSSELRNLSSSFKVKLSDIRKLNDKIETKLNNLKSL